jgi:hypothetical protein
LRRFWRLLGWFVVVDALITIFGVTTAPLLLSLAADSVVGLLIIRSCMEMRAAMASPGEPDGITGQPAHHKALLLFFMDYTAASKHSNHKGF